MGKTYLEALMNVIAILKGRHNERMISFNENNAELNQHLREALDEGRLVRNSFKSHAVFLDPKTNLAMVIKFGPRDIVDLIFAEFNKEDRSFFNEFRADKDVLSRMLEAKLRESNSTLDLCEIAFTKNIEVEKHFHEVLDKFVLNNFYYKGLSLDERIKEINKQIERSILNTIVIMDSDTTIIVRTLLEDNTSVECTLTMTKGETLRVVAINHNDHNSLKVSPIVITREVMTALLINAIINTNFYKYYMSKNGGFAFVYEED